MIVILLAIAFLAGVFLIGKEMIPLAGAWRTGRIRTRGYSPRVVDRQVEPERFDRMVSERLKIAGAALVFILGETVLFFVHSGGA